nr:DUF4123 domain-containing protein [Hahella sp. HN01]
MYSIVDCAADGRLYKEIKKSGCRNSSLFWENSDQELISNSPHLVALSDCGLSSFLFEYGWGNNWAIYIASDQPFAEVAHHFRKISKVRGPKGENWFFRYYDPRVLRVILPTLDSQQKNRVFGRIGAFWLEDSDPQIALKFISTNTEICRRKFYLEQPAGEQGERFLIQNFFPDQRPSSKTTRSNLRIRKDQCDDLLTHVVKNEFIKQLTKDFRSAYPKRLCHYNDIELFSAIENSLIKFEELGLDEKEDAYYFVKSCIFFGWDFLDKPCFYWIKMNFLNNGALGPPSTRFREFYKYWCNNTSRITSLYEQELFK